MYFCLTSAVLKDPTYFCLHVFPFNTFVATLTLASFELGAWQQCTRLKVHVQAPPTSLMPALPSRAIGAVSTSGVAFPRPPKAPQSLPNRFTPPKHEQSWSPVDLGPVCGCPLYHLYLQHSIARIVSSLCLRSIEVLTPGVCAVPQPSAAKLLKYA